MNRFSFFLFPCFVQTGFPFPLRIARSSVRICSAFTPASAPNCSQRLDNLFQNICQFRLCSRSASVLGLDQVELGDYETWIIGKDVPCGYSCGLTSNTRSIQAPFGFAEPST